MAIALRNSAATAYDNVASTYTVAKASGTVAGDVMLVNIGVLSTTAAFTAPTGWAPVGDVESATGLMHTGLYYKVAGASEPSSYSWIPSTASRGYIETASFSGVDQVNPIDAFSSGAVHPAASSATISLTIGSAGAWMWTGVMGRHPAAAARTFDTSDASDLSEYSHWTTMSSSGFDYIAAIWDSHRALTSGAQSRTITPSSGTDLMSWWMVSLRPAGTGTVAARIYQAGLSTPLAAVAPRGRIYQAALTTPAASGGLKARFYVASLTAPTAGISTAGSGIYSVHGGNMRSVAIYSVIAGELT